MKRSEEAANEMLCYLRAIVALQAAAMTDSEDFPRPEVLLQRAGLDIGEIAQLLGKSYPAVAKTISRERLSKREK